MWNKKLKLGLAGGLLIGAFLLQHNGGLAPPFELPPLTGPSSTDDPHEQGRVVADDERSDSGPFQHIAGEGDTTGVIAGNYKKRVTRSDQVAVVDTDPIVYIDDGYYPLRTYKPMLAPNDPSASQWWVSNAKLNQGWDIPAGSNETTLAIIDTGFALNHEEFVGRWHENSAETGAAASEAPSKLNCTDRGLAVSRACNLIDDNADRIVDNEAGAATYENDSQLNCTDQGRPLTKDCNLIDDDGNGYVDDVNGWDFIHYDNTPQAGELNPSGTGTTHGTRVAGVAAATGNNGKGIAGVNWDTKILPLQALDDDSYGTTREVGRAINYAVDQGADVISISLGTELPDSFVREAIARATAAGAVVVAATGNDGCNCIVYPANYPEVVAVGALASTNAPASFSSYGASLDIMAPGSGMTSTTWTAGNQTSAYASGINGTSYATPIVGGALARLKSSQPDITPLQLIAALTESTDRMTLGSSISRSSSLGYGKLDLQKAQSRVTTPETSELLYTFSALSVGNLLTPGTEYESTGSYIPKRCESSRPGTTKIHELIKGSSHFFSMSEVEVWRAKAAGYSTTLFAELCLMQPHDTYQSLRAINTLSEFRNITTKPQF